MSLLCCDVGLVSELRLTAGCVLMDLASPAVSGMSVYANGLKMLPVTDYNVDFGTIRQKTNLKGLFRKRKLKNLSNFN